VGAVIRVVDPTADEVVSALSTLSDRLDDKLGRGFPHFSADRRAEQKRTFIKAALRSENLLDQMRVEMPELWERTMRTILLEEERLVTGSGSSVAATAHLNSERAALREALADALPSIEPTSLTAIAYGQIGQWLIECPLDFEPT
jgi:4-diphosphocytidyl-2C-methyl-D-erythritol kinase